MSTGEQPTPPSAIGRSSRDAPTLRYDLTREELGRLLDGEPRYRLDQLWTGLHQIDGDLEQLSNVPRALRARLTEMLPVALTPEAESVSDDGETVKWLWKLHDGHQIETVLMHYRDRTTVCVSSQAGCAMGCGFCATGQSGFDRHLSVGEIVEQVIMARRTSAPRRVSNVVFMGMGEPFANYDRTWAAVERIHGDLGLGARHLTISTVGIVPCIDRLAREALPVGLAVSLHAADDELRDRLVPINRTYPIEALVGACGRYLAAKNRRLSFEWALIDGVNDRAVDAEQLSGLCRRLRAHVNLIPLNPTPGYLTPGTPMPRVRQFRDHLAQLGVNATIRRTRGTDIDAACGQLRASRQVIDPPRRRIRPTMNKPESDPR